MFRLDFYKNSCFFFRILPHIDLAEHFLEVGRLLKLAIRSVSLSGHLYTITTVFSSYFFAKCSPCNKPSSTPVTIEAKLSSSSIMSAACLLTSDPAIPIATPVYTKKLADSAPCSMNTRKASCRWQTRATLAKRLYGLCKSSGVVSCIASLPIDSLPMVSY